MIRLIGLLFDLDISIIEMVFSNFGIARFAEQEVVCWERR